MIMTNLTSDLKKLACAYDSLILEKLGFLSVTSRGVQQSCPIHNGDNPLAFSYDRSKCCWSCFTHGCHKKFGNDIIGLIQAVKNISFNETVDWIEEIIANPEITAGYIPNEKQDQRVLENRAISEKVLERLSSDYTSVKDRGFDGKTLAHFECGCVLTGNRIQHHRIMIPIRDANGTLIGFTGRSIFQKCERTGAYHPEWANEDGLYSSLFSKWRHYPKGLNKSIELYNFHEAEKYIKRIGFAVVVEGPFDLWRLWELGVKNCVASFGCSISQRQITKLKETGCKCVAICFDNDKSGINGFDKAKIVFDNQIKIEKITIPIDKDPGLITVEDYNCVIKPQLSVLRKRHENQNYNNNW